MTDRQDDKADPDKLVKETEVEETNETAESTIEQKVVASHTEAFLQKHVAPVLISKYGKISVLAIYLVTTLVCIHRLTDVKVYFSQDLFVNEEFREFDFLQIKQKYWKQTYKPNIFVFVKHWREADEEQL